MNHSDNHDPINSDKAESRTDAVQTAEHDAAAPLPAAGTHLNAYIEASLFSEEELDHPLALEPEQDDEASEGFDPGTVDGYGGQSPEHIKKILEAAIFASGKTLSLAELGELFEAYERPRAAILRRIMNDLMAEYADRGIALVEVASGYRFQTEAKVATWVARLWEEKPQRYSRALMETIALIAYRQPITRGEIESVRGVAVSSNIVRTLLEREWVRVVGHRDVPGHPAMYATTKQFLDYFGLSSLDEMPNLSEIRQFDDPQSASDTQTPEPRDREKTGSFSRLIDNIRDGESTGKTGNAFIDEHLDNELSAMDAINAKFEKSLEQSREPDESADSAQEPAFDDGDEPAVHPSHVVEPQARNTDTKHPIQETDPDVSDEEKWKIIQEKLAQQQALLDDRENDSQRKDSKDE